MLTAPEPSDVTAVTSWLEAQHIAFSIERECIFVSSTVAKLEPLLSTSFANYRRDTDGRTLVRASEYALPSAVAAATAAVVGLHGVPLPPKLDLSVPPTKPPAVTPSVLAATYHVSIDHVDKSSPYAQAVAEFQGEVGREA